MLKRAKCTVYSVQDTDTLGKDSELAATLAQGKPVIAYVPSKSEPDRITELLGEEPQTVLERLRFVLNADERFMVDLAAWDRTSIAEFRDLPDFAHTTVFRSVPDREALENFRSRPGPEMEKLCRLIAASEKRIYDSRANTLKRFHPLGIQVNLATGVANGVMVVRNVAECAALLRRNEVPGLWRVAPAASDRLALQDRGMLEIGLPRRSLRSMKLLWPRIQTGAGPS